MTDSDITFEEALAELEQIVERLETGDLTLDDMLAQFERGQELTAFCEQALAAAEQRLEVLRPAPGGGYEAVPYDEDAGA